MTITVKDLIKNAIAALEPIKDNPCAQEAIAQLDMAINGYASAYLGIQPLLEERRSLLTKGNLSEAEEARADELCREIRNRLSPYNGLSIRDVEMADLISRGAQLANPAS
jgi:hypothetical protein